MRGISRWHRICDSWGGKLRCVVSTIKDIARGRGAAFHDVDATACLAMVGLARTVPALRARFGAIERGFYLFAITWCAVFAVACAVRVR